MQTYTTESMHLAAALFACGHEPRVEMLTDRKGTFIFELSEALEDQARRYNLDGEGALVVQPRELFNAWTTLRGRMMKLQKAQ